MNKVFITKTRDKIPEKCILRIYDPKYRLLQTFIINS